MLLTNRLEELISPVLEALGYTVVRILLLANNRKRLEIMIERMDSTALSLEDCTKASRTISALLDVEGLMESAYNLEVTSPGIDRPLTKSKDYPRFLEEKIWVQTTMEIDGQKKFEGILKKFEGSLLTLLLENTQEITIPFDTVVKAKLLRSHHLGKKYPPSTNKNLSIKEKRKTYG